MTGPQPPGPNIRRRLLLSGVAITLAAGALVALVRLAPGQRTDPGAQTTRTSPVAEPSPAAQAPAVPSRQQVPAPASGREFDDWVGKVAGWLDVPPRAMAGYATTTVAMSREKPGCHLSWVTLAAIGKVSTDHGRATGSAIGDDGTMVKPIGTLEVRDFYGHVVSTPDASGPMQLSPALWKKYRPAGRQDVQNVDDAALATARSLCDGGRDLTGGQAWWQAVSTVQGAPLFLHRVLATANVYGTVGMDSAPPKPAVLRAVNFAIDKIGLPYVWGGNGEERGDPGFDCSGLTTAAYGGSGITLKRTADRQYHSVPLIPAGTEPQLGDLIFYGDPGTGIHHVGLYIGNQQMIDAPTFGQAVQVHPYRKPGDDYAGAGRPAA